MIRVVPKTCATCSFYRVREKSCSASGTQNPVTGDLEYHQAKDVRRNVAKCGPRATWWVYDTLWDLRAIDTQGVLPKAPCSDQSPWGK